MNRLWFSMVALLLLTAACKGDDEVVLVGDWERIGDFGGAMRTNASSFIIDGYPYICLGYNSKATEYKSGMNDLWRFSPAEGWIEKAKLPAEFLPRYGAVSFSIGKKGYVGLGQNGTQLYLKDFWEYNSETDTWRKVADFPGGVRYSAIASAASGKGYVGFGTNGILRYNDFWQYTPDSGDGKWEAIPGYNGSKREGGSTFVLNNKIYLFGGKNSGFAYDFHNFDPATGKWTKLRDIRNASTETFDDDYNELARENASIFVINGNAFVALGDRSGQVMSATYQYDPASDQWTKVTAWEGNLRTNAVAYYFNNRGFVATGGASSTFYDDVWEFHPGVDRVDNN